MLKHSGALLLIFISLSVFGQQKIDNVRTENHVYIKGTKIYLIPPKGFTVGQNFLGLQQNESGSSIMLLDIPGPYSETSAGLNAENLLGSGVEVSNIEQLTFNGLSAMLITGKQHAYGNSYTKYILVFGDESETIMINGVSSESMKKIGAKIKESMLSAVYDAGMKLDPFAALDYTIDVSETKLKFAGSMSNSLIFTVDGKIPTASKDKTNLIVTKSFNTVTPEDKKLFCINRIKKTPVDIQNIEYVNEITVDGINGYEIYAKAKSKNAEETENIYQVILFSDNLYYILVSTTNDETVQSVEEAKKAIHTFNRK
ncbi:MAG: hypothetical protein KF880_08650 [Ferruginibacter sp.]|nr:hypothetical protein [Ferruginibacter sp.]